MIPPPIPTIDPKIADNPPININRIIVNNMTFAS